MMLPNDIEKLLARFYAGETTAEEEQTLKEYFARTDVPPALHADRDMFRQLTEEDLPEVPEGMEERLSAFIDRLEENETERHFHRPVIRWRRQLGMAAMICLLVSTGVYFLRPAQPPTPKDTCATPEEAQRETEKALSILAYGLRRGMEGVQTASQTTEKAHEQVIEQLNHIKQLPQ